MTGAQPGARGQRRDQRREEAPWRPSAWDALREGRWRLPSSAAVGGLVVVAGVVVLLVLGSGVGVAREPTPTPGVAVPPRSGPASTRPSGPASDASSEPTAATASTSPTASALTQLVVDVTGQVAQPGVVRLPPGARVDDAVRAAGGALPSADLQRVNLARPLLDGEQVVVPAPGEDLPAGAAPGTLPAGGATTGDGPPDDGGADPAAASPVDLNTATLADLDALPGVGPVLAQRILDWREEHGRFSSVEELGEVAGIGPARLADLSTLVLV